MGGEAINAPPLPSLASQFSEETVAMEGAYALNYDTLKPLGKGAFGFVRLARRKDDHFMVHTLYICTPIFFINTQ